MKKLLLATTMVLSMSANADNRDKYEICELTSSLAGQIMESRQHGLPMTKVMALLKEDIKPVFAPFVVEAYKQPLFSAEKNKKSAVTEFQNGAYIGCIEAYEG